MKNLVWVILLLLVSVGLAIGLFVIRKQASERQAHDAERMDYYSNQWVTTGKKLDDQVQVTAVYEKDLEAKKQALADLTNSYSRLSANLTEVSSTLTQTETSLKTSQEEIVKRDAKIVELENQNHALDDQAKELSLAITNLTQQIEDTKKRLLASEGDKGYLERQLKQLLTEKAELERKFTDLAVLRAQVRKVREELAVARRQDWIRRGVYAPTAPKGAQRLMQGSMAFHPPPPPTNNSLNVELTSTGGARILPPGTNSPASTNPPAK